MRIRPNITLILAATLLASRSMAAPTWEKVKPLLQTYCWDCHGEGTAKGDISLENDHDEAAIKANRKLWSAVQFHVEQWTMPPSDRKTQPTKAERDEIVQWLGDLLDPIDPHHPDPGRVTIRRLNRVEYNNTVRDLLGDTTRPADEFPEDDTGFGFDNVGDVLSLAPLLMERYLIAADRVLADAMPAIPASCTKQVFNESMLKGSGIPSGNARLLSSNGETSVDYRVILKGEYILRATVWSNPLGNDPAKMELRVNGKAVKQVDVSAISPATAQTFEIRVKMNRGRQAISVAFLNDQTDPNATDPDRRDRNLYIHSLEVEGPVTTDPDPQWERVQRSLRPAVGQSETKETAREILGNFTSRAFRRTALPSEIDRLMALFDMAQKNGDPWQESLRTAMKAVLLSPWFLYRIEWQPNANNAAGLIDLSDFALASRLSYWLWSSTPDDELLTLASRDQLKPALHQQIQRVLKDPKARALPENFGGQWLELRSLAIVAPDKDRFPDFSRDLADSMRGETTAFFWHIMQENRPLTEFVTADYTFLDETMARFYNVPNITGPEFRMVQLPPDSPRAGGVLTHAGILTLTSDSSRTSPVKRGKWLLENILGVTAPPPPPNIPALAEGPHIETGASVRQRLEKHRSKPGCISCHRLIDPLGFALESFNAIGQFRHTDGNSPIDCTGTLTTGQTFSNARELASIISHDKCAIFLRTVVKKMFTYALGRGPEPSDRPTIDAILAHMDKEGNTFESMIMGIAESIAFKKRRGNE